MRQLESVCLATCACDDECVRVLAAANPRLTDLNLHGCRRFEMATWRNGSNNGSPPNGPENGPASDWPFDLGRACPHLRRLNLSLTRASGPALDLLTRCGSLEVQE